MMCPKRFEFLGESVGGPHDAEAMRNEPIKPDRPPAEASSQDARSNGNVFDCCDAVLQLKMNQKGG